MNVFSTKSICLYSLAIISAIGFFNFVTSYGEANIKAPISVDGNYLITAQNLPTCLQHNQLILKLQQSGIYVNAILVNDRPETPTTQASHPTLSGRLHVRQLNLIGSLPPALCPQSWQLQIAGSFGESLPSNLTKNRNSAIQLQGKLWFTSPEIDSHSERLHQRASPIEFIGIRQSSTR
jgi:hypothetical protein